MVLVVERAVVAGSTGATGTAETPTVTAVVAARIAEKYILMLKWTNIAACVSSVM